MKLNVIFAAKISKNDLGYSYNDQSFIHHIGHYFADIRYYRYLPAYFTHHALSTPDSNALCTKFRATLSLVDFSKIFRDVYLTFQRAQSHSDEGKSYFHSNDMGDNALLCHRIVAPMVVESIVHRHSHLHNALLALFQNVGARRIGKNAITIHSFYSSHLPLFFCLPTGAMQVLLSFHLLFLPLISLMQIDFPVEVVHQLHK